MSICGTIASCLDIIAEYVFEIFCADGKKHMLADYLSRSTGEKETEQDE